MSTAQVLKATWERPGLLNRTSGSPEGHGVSAGLLGEDRPLGPREAHRPWKKPDKTYPRTCKGEGQIHQLAWLYRKSNVEPEMIVI